MVSWGEPLKTFAHNAETDIFNGKNKFIQWL